MNLWSTVLQLILFLKVNSGEFCPCAEFDKIQKSCQELDDRLTCLPGGEVFDGEAVSDPQQQWPYLVSLQIQHPNKSPGCYSHICGGSLIAPNVVLSAAHCFTKIFVDKSGGVPRFNIYVAQAPYCRHQPSSNNGLRSQVEYISIHPDWDKQNPSGDIAVLRLNQNLQGPFVQLEQAFTNRDRSVQITIAGYGDIDPQETRNKTMYNMVQLYQAPLRYFTGSLCELYMDQFDSNVGNKDKSSDFLNYNTMICAYDENMDSCEGDSGGPAAIKGVTPEDDLLVGVMSWGPFNQCLNHIKWQAPAVLARVSAYYAWIQENMEEFKNLQVNGTAENGLLEGIENVKDQIPGGN